MYLQYAMSEDTVDDEISTEIEHINNAVEDGGGCAETWEAVSELRNDNSQSRRSFVKYVAAALGIGGLPAMSEKVSAQSEPTTKTDVSLIERGSEWQTAVTEATSDSAVDQLTQFLEQKGYYKQSSETLILRSDYEDRTWYSVKFRFETQDADNSYGFVTWSGLEDLRPRGSIVIPKEQEVSVEKYGVVDGEITSNLESNTDDDITTQGPPTLCPGPGRTPDIDCIATLADAYALDITSCGICVVSAGWLTAACAVCVATIIEGDYDTVCDPCNWT